MANVLFLSQRSKNEKRYKNRSKTAKKPKGKIELLGNVKMDFELYSLNLEKVVLYAFNLSLDEASKKHDFSIKIKGDELKNEFMKNYANLLEKE